MASKRDLVEAQTFSRRRLLTAFVSGAPSGQELEPAKPLRGVVAGVVLTVLLVLGSLAFGLLKPGLAAGWDKGSLVVVSETGTRYVAIDGTLYPVLNTTSARLVVPSSQFSVHTVSEDDIAGSPRGATIGIAGAPDAPPAQDRLVATGWLSCLVPDGGGARTTLGVDVPTAAAGDAGVLVQVADDVYVVADGRRHLVPAEHGSEVLRALQLDDATPVTVPAAWLTLFPDGADLEPVAVDGAGERAPEGAGLPAGTLVGTVVEVDGVAGADRHYVVDRDGELAPLSDVALALYAGGSQDVVQVTTRMSPAEVADVRTAQQSPAPADWPTALPSAVPAGRVACARLTTGGPEPTAGEGDAATVELVTAPADEHAEPGVLVAPGGGALLVARSAPGAVGTVALVDESGTAFPVPDASTEVLARLGYARTAPVAVPPAWAALFAQGPELTPEAAGAAVGADRA